MGAPRGAEPTLDVSASPEKQDRAVGCDGGTADTPTLSLPGRQSLQQTGTSAEGLTGRGPASEEGRAGLRGEVSRSAELG